MISPRFVLLYPVSARGCYVIQDSTSGFRWHYEDGRIAEIDLIRALSASEFKAAMTLTGIPGSGCQCDKGDKGPAQVGGGEEVKENMKAPKMMSANGEERGAGDLPPFIRPGNIPENETGVRSVMATISSEELRTCPSKYPYLADKEGNVTMQAAVDVAFKDTEGKKTIFTWTPGGFDYERLVKGLGEDTDKWKGKRIPLVVSQSGKGVQLVRKSFEKTYFPKE